MSEWTYNTDHSSICIQKKNHAALLEAVNQELIKFNCPKVDTLNEAFEDLGFGLYYDEEEGEGEGDIVDIHLRSSRVDEENWEILKTVVGPFVEAGSYLVFAYGGTQGVWGISFEEDVDTGKVQGKVVEVIPVMEKDFEELVLMLLILQRKSPSLRDLTLKKLIGKYASVGLRAKIKTEIERS